MSDVNRNERHHLDRKKNSPITVNLNIKWHFLLHAVAAAGHMDEFNEGAAYMDMRDAKAVLGRMKTHEQSEALEWIKNEESIRATFGVGDKGWDYIRRKLLNNEEN